MSASKSEKQLINDKVNKVREVVRNVSNNDIVLALHNFDMDVNRTIHAFTEVGLENALGSWEKSGAAAKKNKKKKTTVGGTGTSSTATSTTTETPKVSSASSARQNGTKSTTAPVVAKPKPVAPVQATTKPEPIPSLASLSKLSDNNKQSEVDRLLHELDVKSAHITHLLDTAHAQKSAAISAILSAVHARDHQLGTQLDATRHNAEQHIARARSALIQLKNSGKGDLSTEFARLSTDSTLDEIINGKFTFDEKPSIRSVNKFGAGYLPAADAPLTSVNGTTPVFVPPPPAQNQPAPPPYTKEKPVQNGKPKTEKPSQVHSSPVNKLLNGSDVNHSTSQSSLVSSIGEDSGLGQVSPVAAEKNVAQITDGGIVMQSDGLSSDQLAELQRHIAENLKAKGIDASVLSGISGLTTSVAPRRRAPRGPPNGAAGNKPGNKNKQNGKPIESH